MTQITISNSKFKNLRGWCGAALYINNIEYVSITSTLFENNSVPLNQKELLENFTAFQIQFKKEKSNKTEMDNQLFDDFYLNKKFRGGAVYYNLNERNDFKQFILQGNTFINNRAHKGSFAYFAPEGIEIML